MGGAPQEDEDCTVEQLSALNKWVAALDLPPYVDLAVWQPYRRLRPGLPVRRGGLGGQGADLHGSQAQRPKDEAEEAGGAQIRRTCLHRRRLHQNLTRPAGSAHRQAQVADPRRYTSFARSKHFTLYADPPTGTSKCIKCRVHSRGIAASQGLPGVEGGNF